MAQIPADGTAFNPIVSVDGATLTVTPSEYSFEWEDVSKSSAGRTEDGKMHKEMIGHVLAYNIKFNALTYMQMATVLNAFKPEYVSVTLLSPENGTHFVTKTMYVGNRSGAVFNTHKHYWQGLSFKLIEQDVSN